jgi:ATP-dependent RNA helicase DeaD
VAGAAEPGSERDGDFVELYLDVGRRDGARAADIQKALQDKAGLDKNDVVRIRVRERNAFVGVRRSEHQKAIAALSSVTIGGRSVTAEVARERSSSSKASQETDARASADEARGIEHHTSDDTNGPPES